MKTTSTYGAELIDVMGSDLTVVNAARVSFDKQSELEEVTETLWEDNVLLGPLPYDVKSMRLKDADKRLIAYLAKHKHWTPFAHPQLSFRVSAPLFVARQLQKHQVGLAWNEVSRRYVDSEPSFYVPDAWRKRTDNVKQGSSDDILADEIFGSDEYGAFSWSPRTVYRMTLTSLIALYRDLLDAGCCPEQARMVLPQSMMTEWVWTGSLAAFARVVNQRLDPHAQRECRPVAQDIATALQQHFPVSWEALRENKPQ